MSQDSSPFSIDTPGEWTLVVSVASGHLQVRTHDAPRTDIAITGARDEQDVTLHSDERGREVSVKQNRRGRFNWRGGSLAITATVPVGTVVRVNGESLDIDVAGRVGDLTVNTASGDLRADEVHGTMRSHTASGDVAVRHVTGSLLVRSASGDLDVGRADHDVTVQSASGDISIERLSAGRASVHSVSGDVDLGVAPGLRLHLELASLSGTTRPELDLGSDNDDEPIVALDINARTVSGDIRVRRSHAVVG
jgi:DUF4097 and DUF4098 domain-containing protein YvlB